MDWKIYLDDGSTFGDEDGTPLDAPGWGVQVIAQADPQVGRRLISQADYYIFIDGNWVGLDDVGLIDYLANILKIVKVGRQLPIRNDYRAILEQARTDPDLPAKDGWLQDEPRG